MKKTTAWLVRCNEDPGTDAHDVLGRVLRDFMEKPDGYPFTMSTVPSDLTRGQQRVADALARFGLSYRQGGVIHGGTVSAPSRSLDDLIAKRDHPSIEREFDRALAAVESDPEAALTAACAIVESACKVYIESRRLQMPAKQTIKPLWAAVQGDLGLRPDQIEDADLKRILGGLTSIVDGVGALRTHASSAHGRGGLRYQVAGRHARLAVHASHTVVGFLLETWQAREQSGWR